MNWRFFKKRLKNQFLAKKLDKPIKISTVKYNQYKI